MKTFETPYIDVKKFDVEDILTTSGEVVDPSEFTTEEEEPVMVTENCF